MLGFIPTPTVLPSAQARGFFYGRHFMPPSTPTAKPSAQVQVFFKIFIYLFIYYFKLFLIFFNSFLCI